MSDFNDFILDQITEAVNDTDKPYKFFYDVEWFNHTDEDGFVWRSNPGDKVWDWVDENVLGKKVGLALAEFLYEQYDPAEVISGIEQIYLAISEQEEDGVIPSCCNDINGCDECKTPKDESTEGQRERPCECGSCDVVGGTCEKQLASYLVRVE